MDKTSPAPSLNYVHRDFHQAKELSPLITQYFKILFNMGCHNASEWLQSSTHNPNVLFAVFSN